MCELVCILRSPEKGEHEAVEQCCFLPGCGIEGDRGADGGARQVSLCDEAALPDRAGRGLCHKRFFANLVFRGLDFSAMRPGSRIALGTALLEVTDAGKRCFPECTLVQAGTPCALPQNVAYARVVQGGVAAVHDRLTVQAG